MDLHPALREAIDQGKSTTSEDLWVLLLAGPFFPPSRLSTLAFRDSPLIIVDGGIKHFSSFFSSPLVWMGDFDSSPRELRERYAWIPQRQFREDKDQTDGELAIIEAIRRGAKRLLLVGGCGGRTDHTLAHGMLACGLAFHGIEVTITNGEEDIHPLFPRKFAYDFPLKSRFSVVPLSPLEGLSIKGAKWPLKNHTQKMTSTLTLSNEAVETSVSFELQEGYGLIVVYPFQEVSKKKG